MNEGYYFLGACALLSLLLCWFMGRFPRAFTWLVVLGTLLFALGAEHFLLSYEPFPGMVLSTDTLPGSQLALGLHLLCLPLVLVLLLQLLLPPLRRPYSRRVAHFLFVAGCTLLSLQMALWLDSLNPYLFYMLLGRMPFAGAVGCVVAGLLLWQLAVLALDAQLEGRQRRLRRRQVNAAVPPAPQEAPPPKPRRWWLPLP